MGSEPRDGYDRYDRVLNTLDIVLKAVGAILLPIIILIVGNQFTAQQKISDDNRLDQQRVTDKAQHDADRMALLLTHLSSTNSKERLLTVHFIEYFTEVKQFPPELLPLILNSVDDGDQQVAAAASTVLAQAITKDADVAKSVANAAEANPATKLAVKNAANSNPSLRKAIDVAKIQKVINQ